jgi:hypothetical protein
MYVVTDPTVNLREAAADYIQHLPVPVAHSAAETQRGEVYPNVERSR